MTTKFLPAKRVLSDFNKKKEATSSTNANIVFDGDKFQKLEPIDREHGNIKNMVVIEFRHVPRMTRFRWDKRWWTKTTNFKGTMVDELHELEIPSSTKVGVLLRSLNEIQCAYIIPIK